MRADPSHTSDSSSSRTPLGRLIGRVLRRLDARGSATRRHLAIGAGVVLAIAAVAYLAMPGGESEAWEPLYPGRKLSATEAERIASVLVAAKLPHDLDNRGTLSVPASRRNEARALLVSKDSGPRSLPDVLDEIGHQGSLLEGSAERELRLHRLHEEALELMIRELPAIESASVMISRPKYRSASSRGERPTAVVYLKVDRDGAISQETVTAIRNLVTSREPDVKPDALTVQEAGGRAYLVAGRPELGARALVRQKEEDDEARIRERLTRIEGVRVFVRIDSPAAGSADASPAPSLGVNTPLGDPAPASIGAGGRAMVLVQVPITYYIQLYRSYHGGGHDPSPEDLQPYADKIRDSIEAAVANAIPADELASVKVSRIDVPGALRPTGTTPTAASEIRRFSEWTLGAVGLGAVTVLALLALGGRWLAGRRPSNRLYRPQRRPTHPNDSTAPSERVRELVRRDPEAAAGVLQRWIGGGGDE